MGDAQSFLAMTRKLLSGCRGQPGRRADRCESEDVVCQVPRTLVCVDAQLVLSLSVVVFNVRV